MRRIHSARLDHDFFFPKIRAGCKINNASYEIDPNRNENMGF